MLTLPIDIHLLNRGTGLSCFVPIFETGTEPRGAKERSESGGQVLAVVPHSLFGFWPLNHLGYKLSTFWIASNIIDCGLLCVLCEARPVPPL